MATQAPIVLTDVFQPITSAQAYIQITGRAVVEYYTGVDLGGSIKTEQGFGYPGGDTLFAKTDTASFGDNIIITADEVA